MTRIITDSTAGIDQEEAKKLEIDIVPLYVLMNDNLYRDRIDYTDDEFYNLLDHHQPTTSQPSAADFLTYFEQYQDDDIICITISDKLSGTYQSAMIAKKMSERENIHIVNSENVSLGTKMLVLKAVELKNQEYSVSNILSVLETMKDQVVTMGMCDTLEHLKRGGRISNIKFLAGTLLNIKPLLTVENGLLQAYRKKARGKEKAMEILIDCLEETYNKKEPILIGYTNTKENAELLIKKIKNREIYLDKDKICELGSVIGTHAGKNAFILCFVKQS